MAGRLMATDRFMKTSGEIGAVGKNSPKVSLLNFYHSHGNL